MRNPKIIVCLFTLAILALFLGTAYAGTSLEKSTPTFADSHPPHTAFTAQSSHAKSFMSTHEVASLPDFLVIGDSNTVRIANLDTALNKAKDIVAVSGAGVSNWRTKTDASSTIDSQSIFECLEMLDDADLAHVLVLLGTNDYRLSEDDFVEAYAGLLDYLYSRNTDAEIVLGTPLRVNDTCSPTITDDDADQVAECVRAIAQERGLRVLDLYAHMEPDDMSTSGGDGYHLSEAGATKAADYICDYLE